jgi:hypothetical protein
MERTKEYFLKMQEQQYNDLGNDEKMYLNSLGLEVRQTPNKTEATDPVIKDLKKDIAKKYESLNNYLFKLRNN